MKSLKHEWSTAGEYFEYTAAANPRMPEIKAQGMQPNLADNLTKIEVIDFSAQLQTDYPATTPNCLVNFVNICAGESVNCAANATSNLFVVLSGSGTVSTSAGTIDWNSGDVLAIPYEESIALTASSVAVLYWVNDAPILNYLQVKPQQQSFAPTIYPWVEINRQAAEFNLQQDAVKRNRNGVLLGNKNCALTKTITPSLWALFNVIPPNTIQAPHRHNSVALDLSLEAKAGVYTLMSPELDANGNLLNPQRFDWGKGKAFITPPAWWHVHVNESDADAYVLPLQDAGLQTYMRTLFIQFRAPQ